VVSKTIRQPTEQERGKDTEECRKKRKPRTLYDTMKPHRIPHTHREKRKDAKSENGKTNHDIQGNGEAIHLVQLPLQPNVLRKDHASNWVIVCPLYDVKTRGVRGLIVPEIEFNHRHAHHPSLVWLVA
jgi:hypothetical protein